MNRQNLSDNRATLAIAATIVAAVVFGGGGSRYGMANLLVQLCALATLAFSREAFFAFWQSASGTLRALVILTLLIPIIQLIPVPESVWIGLPGRELVAQSFELSGKSGWSPISVEPIRTLLALTALIVPLTVLGIGWTAKRDHLLWVGWLIVALGLANFAIGIPQVLSNSELGVLYPENPMPGVLFGTFANRNSAGLFLVGALSLAALLPPPARSVRSATALRLGSCLLLLVAIILTRSRTALMLAAIPIAAAVVRMLVVRMNRSGSNGSQNQNSTRQSRPWLLVAPVVLVVAALTSWAVAGSGRVDDVMERFAESGDDARVYIWEDAMFSAERYWPVGSGMGSFDDVFQVDESLENLTMRTAGRAHNDYLEVAIEAGALGLLLVVSWLSFLALWSWRAKTSDDRWIAWSGSVILLVIALQSITDYPLRNLSNLALASFGLVILLRFGVHQKEAEQ